MATSNTRDDDMYTFRPEMVSFGYKFAKNFGGPFPKNELVEDLKYYTKCVAGAVERMGGIDKYLDFIIQEMLDHKMILEDGRNLVWNPDYQPSDEDIWCGWEEFTGKDEE